MEDPIEIRPPGSNPIFITFHVENMREKASFVRLNGALLDLRHSSTIERAVSKLGIMSISANLNTRRQLFNRLGYWLT